MATDSGFVEHVREQSGLGEALSYRRMFGEYALYLDGKVVALACDNQLFVKPTSEARPLLARVHEQPPYPGAKPHWLMVDEIDDRDLLRRVLVATALALPPPRPKKRKVKVARGSQR